jgi:pyruvate formate lyase activating enzyme
MAEILLFDIKHYALHDGRGIRSTFFFKGCPLRCPWCHNPESCSTKPHEYQSIQKFKGKTLKLTKTVGKYYSLDELMQTIKKNQLLYEESGGGITLSGGEPLIQADAAQALLKECRSMNLHTCLDTSGYASEKNLNKLMPYADEILFDLKLIDDKKHRQYTGVSNRSILKNLRLIDQIRPNLRIRIPIIPGINADEQSLEAFLEFLSLLKHRYPIDLLPYHKLGSHKKEQLTLSEAVTTFEEPNSTSISQIQSKFAKAGYEVKIGG